LTLDLNDGGTVTVRTIRWVRNRDGSDPFSGDDEFCLLVQALRTAVEDALPKMKYQAGGRTAVFLPELHKIVRNKRQLQNLSTPGLTLFYETFSAQRRGETVANVLTSIGVDNEIARELGNRVEALRPAGFARDAELPDPKAASDAAKLLADIRACREEWEAGNPGTEAYRPPSGSLPDENPDLLTPALRLATQGDDSGGRQLSEEDVAYCLFSACKHGRDIFGWVSLCKASESAAEAMVDLIGWMSWTRPSLRAAWCLSQFDPPLRERAVALAKRQYIEADNEVHELLDAIVTDRVDEHIDSLVVTDALGDNTWKARAVLEEIQRVPLLRGARGGLADVTAFLDSDAGGIALRRRANGLQSALLDARGRFEMKAGDGGGYRYFQGNHFARIARVARKRFDEVSDEDKAFLLRGAIFVQCGMGFGIFNFLPRPTDTWPLPVFADYLAQNDYRTPRYHCAMILQYMEFSDRDRFVRECLSSSRFQRIDELCEAITSRTVQQFFEDPILCYDYLAHEGDKRLALKATAADLRGEYA